MDYVCRKQNDHAFISDERPLLTEESCFQSNSVLMTPSPALLPLAPLMLPLIRRLHEGQDMSSVSSATLLLLSERCLHGGALTPDETVHRKVKSVRLGGGATAAWAPWRIYQTREVLASSHSRLGAATLVITGQSSISAGDKQSPPHPTLPHLTPGTGLLATCRGSRVGRSHAPGPTGDLS